jgi:hypothetical protein
MSKRSGGTGAKRNLAKPIYRQTHRPTTNAKYYANMFAFKKIVFIFAAESFYVLCIA